MDTQQDLHYDLVLKTSFEIKNSLVNIEDLLERNFFEIILKKCKVEIAKAKKDNNYLCKIPMGVLPPLKVRIPKRLPKHLKDSSYIYKTGENLY